MTRETPEALRSPNLEMSKSICVNLWNTHRYPHFTDEETARLISIEGLANRSLSVRHYSYKHLLIWPMNWFLFLRSLTYLMASVPKFEIYESLNDDSISPSFLK